MRGGGFRGRWAAAVALLLVGCSRRGTGERDAGGVGPAPVAAAPDASADPVHLTRKSLDAFIAYQAVLLDVERELGAASLSGGPDERQRLARLAQTEEEARRRSGLSDDELEAWEGLVLEVMAARAQPDSASEKELSQKIAALAARLPGLDLKTDESGDRGLGRVKARHGAVAVELVLSREAVLRSQLARLQP